jgi:hypothetical protein
MQEMCFNFVEVQNMKEEGSLPKSVGRKNLI